MNGSKLSILLNYMRLKDLLECMHRVYFTSEQTLAYFYSCFYQVVNAQLGRICTRKYLLFTSDRKHTAVTTRYFGAIW
jgi:hypothetical protein